MGYNQNYTDTLKVYKECKSDFQLTITTIVAMQEQKDL